MSFTKTGTGKIISKLEIDKDGQIAKESSIKKPSKKNTGLSNDKKQSTN